MKNTRPVMFGIGFVLMFTAMNIFYTIKDEDVTAQGSFCRYDIYNIDRYSYPIPSELLPDSFPSSKELLD